jgi:hypothetical protein
MATQTAPAPASPAPSAPSVAEPTGSGAGDPLEALRNDTIAWGHNPSGSSDTPAETTTSDAAGSTPAAPEQTTAEGSTPPSDSQPATTDAPTSSDHESWVKRYGDPDKAAKEAFALETRAAEMAKRIKELEAGQTPPASTTPQATAPAAQAAQPTPTAQPAEQPQAPTVPTNDQELVEHALKNDEKCRALLDQYNSNEALLKALATEITALQQEIANADILIAHPSVDELVKDEARQVKQRADMTLAAREARASKLDLDNQKLDLRFSQRIGEHASRLQQQTAIRAREAEIVQEAETKASEFIGNWPAAFDAEFKAQGIDPEMRADIHEAVKVMALARPGRIDVKDLPAFFKEAIKSEFTKVDKYHRIQARQHALRKNADTNPAAPTGSAAAATEVSAPVSTEDHLTALRNMTREVFRSKRGA